MRAFAAALLLAFAGIASAQWNPTKPVRIVLPFAPGGQSDVILRALAEPLSRGLGQPVVIENRPGAGGNIATEVVARSAPDGHTLLIGTNGPLAISPLMQPNLPFDPVRDLAPVTLLGTSPNLIVVPASLGVTNLAQLADRARAAPGKLNYGSVGVGSVSHLTMALFARIAAVEVVHVPYSGSAPALAALLAGDIHVLSANPTALMAHLASGRVVAIAQTTARRSPLLPQVPTAAEAGFAGLESDLWMAVMAPARTPPEAIARLHAEFSRVARDPELANSIWARQWVDPIGTAGESVSALMRREAERWAPSIRAGGISPQ